MQKTEILMFAIPAIALSGLFLGLFIIGETTRANLEKLHEEQQAKWNEQHQIWNSLDCFGKKQYLDGKDLRSSSLFYYNQNEQFYREYILGCT